MVARAPAVDSVPFLLRAERDLSQALFSEPVSVREVAALPERLFRLFRGFRHSLLPARILLMRGRRGGRVANSRLPQRANRNQPIAGETPRRLKEHDRKPVELEPARSDAKRVAEEGQPRKHEKGRAVAPQAIEPHERLLRADVASDQVRGHAAERVAEGRDRERRPEQLAVNSQHGEEHRLRAQGDERRGKKCRSQQGPEARPGRKKALHAESIAASDLGDLKGCGLLFRQPHRGKFPSRVQYRKPAKRVPPFRGYEKQREKRLSGTDSQGAGVRRGGRDAARSR